MGLEEQLCQTHSSRHHWSERLQKMWYLCVFYHRLLDYRKPEVESLAQLFGVTSSNSLEWKLPKHHHSDSPFHFVNLPSEQIAQNVANRSKPCSYYFSSCICLYTSIFVFIELFWLVAFSDFIILKFSLSLGLKEESIKYMPLHTLLLLASDIAVCESFPSYKGLSICYLWWTGVISLCKELASMHSN